MFTYHERNRNNLDTMYFIPSIGHYRICSYKKEEDINMKKIYPRKWYAKKVLLLDAKQKKIYNLLKNKIMSYQGVVNETTKYFDNFTLHNKMVFKLGAVGNTIKLFLSLNPENYPEGQFPHKDVGDQKKHRYTPFLMKVSSKLSIKRALILIDDVAIIQKLKKIPTYKERDYIKDIEKLWLSYK